MLYNEKWNKVKLEPWQQIILGVADLIDRHGHCQHVLEKDGHYCIGGAFVKLSTTQNFRNKDWRKAVVHVHHACEQDGYNTYVGFNDTPGRTKEEVVQKLRDCAINIR